MTGVTPTVLSPEPPLAPDSPLAPGRLPVVGHGWSMLRDPLGFLGGLHRYGPVVRVQAGTKTFHVLTSPDAVRELLAQHSDTCIRAGVQFLRQRPKLVRRGVLYFRHITYSACTDA